MKEIFKQKQEKIAKKQILLLREGIWSQKDYEFNREEIYANKRNPS